MNANLHAQATPLLTDYLMDAARRWPDKVGLVCKNDKVTYAELDARSNALSHDLVRRGVERGDRVIIFADNTVETVVAFWAVLKANAIVSVVNPLTKADKLAYVLNDCRARALITDAHLQEAFVPAVASSSHLRLVVVSGDVRPGTAEKLPGFVSWEKALAFLTSEPPVRRAIDVDLASIIYTSGSTGDPKGVMMTHRCMLTAATSISTYLEMRQNDVVLCLLPLAFDYGLYQMLMTFRLGGCLVLERSFTYPAEVLQSVVANAVTVFPGVPTVYTILGGMKDLSEFDFSKVRTVTNTAAALQGQHIGIIRRVFPGARIFSMYGLTECKRCTYLPPEDIDRKPESVGIAIPNTELWVVDDQGRRLGPGQTGELVIRGATVMKGYWEKPEQTAKRLRPGPVPGEFVLYTGDLCRLDEDGYLYFVARTDDIIKSRGEKVSPVEVERALYRIEGVKEVAVIGVPDDVLGQAVKAFVVLAPGSTLTAKDIQKESQKYLENFMVPKYVELKDALPKGMTGKVKKTGLA